MLDEDKSKVLIRIVDDDEGVREAISFMLECKSWRTRTYASARDFLLDDNKLLPGCLVLDIRMPQMSGLELQHELVNRGNSLPILILTGHGNLDIAVSSFKLGAFDFLQKPVENDRFTEAIEKACELSLLRTRGELSGLEAALVLAKMSEREKQIVQLLGLGLENRHIAERLGIAQRTVQGHRNNIYKKLSVHNLAALQACLKRAREAGFSL